MEQSDIVINFTILLVAALVGGIVAHRLKQPVILGYLLVGIAIGPHAFALVNNLELVEAAATIGVALLMLTLGLEVSLNELRRVGRVGLWGGALQIILSALLGFIVAFFILGWTFSQALLFGLVISLSSTMVCLKVLMDRGELNSTHARIMLAILVFQDVASILMILIMPVLGGGDQNVLLAIGVALGEAVLFVLIAVGVGIWGLPRLVGRLGGTRSRELFLLIVLVLGLGSALASQIVGLSAVFGAFLIGVVLRETRFAHQALAEITPLRDIFAALFFVSLGMLLDVSFILDSWTTILMVVALIILIKVAVAAGVTKGFGFNNRIAFLVGIGIFQIGEFSFILAQDGVNRGILDERSYSIIIASAIITMLMTPFSIGLSSNLYYRLEKRLPGGKAKKVPSVSGALKPVESSAPASLVVIAGFGTTGQNVARGLQEANIPYCVIEIDPEKAFKLQCGGVSCYYGDASSAYILESTDLIHAKVLVVTFPDPMAVVSTVKAALEINPAIKIVARVHREREAVLLTKMGVINLVSPEYEASLEFFRRTLMLSGRDSAQIGQLMRKVTRDREVIKIGPEEEQ